MDPYDGQGNAEGYYDADGNWVDSYDYGGVGYDDYGSVGYDDPNASGYMDGGDGGYGGGGGYDRGGGYEVPGEAEFGSSDSYASSAAEWGAGGNSPARPANSSFTTSGAGGGGGDGGGGDGGDGNDGKLVSPGARPSLGTNAAKARFAGMARAAAASERPSRAKPKKESMVRTPAYELLH